MIRTTWKDRTGSVPVDLRVHVRSTGWNEDARADEEARHEEEREIVKIEIGGVTLDARYDPALFLALSVVVQEDVDLAGEDEFDWEVDE